MNPLKCIDVDECEHGVVEFSDGVVQKACQRNAYCENAFGYYMCHCISGPFSNQGPNLSLVKLARTPFKHDITKKCLLSFKHKGKKGKEGAA